MAQLLKKVTEVEVREALPPAQFAQLAKTANLRDQKAVKSWDDGMYDGVVKIVANVNKSKELVSIQFTYSNDESMEIKCAKHGGDGDATNPPVPFTLDADEHIFKVKAVYDPTNAYYKKLIFYTNKDKKFDTEKGESTESVIGDKTVEMVGFQGEADANHVCKMSFHKKP